MVDIEEIKSEEVKLEQILANFMNRIQQLEGTVGYMIHQLKIPMPSEQIPVDTNEA
jgi:hypothetical protein